MKSMKFISAAFIALSVLIFAVTAEAYRVEIIPADPADAEYSMKLNEEIAFVAKAYHGEEKSEADEEMPIGRIFWQFDYSYLQMINSDGKTIRLKAIKEGRVDLMVTGIVENYPFTKSIVVTIEK